MVPCYAANGQETVYGVFRYDYSRVLKKRLFADKPVRAKFVFDGSAMTDVMFEAMMEELALLTDAMREISASLRVISDAVEAERDER